MTFIKKAAFSLLSLLFLTTFNSSGSLVKQDTLKKIDEKTIGILKKIKNSHYNTCVRESAQRFLEAYSDSSIASPVIVNKKGRNTLGLKFQGNVPSTFKDYEISKLKKSKKGQRSFGCFLAGLGTSALVTSALSAFQVHNNILWPLRWTSCRYQNEISNILSSTETLAGGLGVAALAGFISLLIGADCIDNATQLNCYEYFEMHNIVLFPLLTQELEKSEDFNYWNEGSAQESKPAECYTYQAS